ncbi:hypothetical protein SO574_02890 [Vibrio alfacsensis]|uniref:hypothetical protein n=1 Tax=Vibrio alfacsensis TaxID=1074311 RepID=UPI002ADE0B1C|nr:hypothetical protein [Vibrio alfacsensis]WQE76767.1 hypothetical protein SO574_02890 [Vibrio alfacsensis]
MKRIKETICQHFERLNLDLRISGNGRYIDQKCTPDVVSSLAEVILEYIERGNESFTIRDLMESEELDTVMVNQFQKPSISHPGAASEYDKVASQPVKLFECAQLIETIESTGRAKRYVVLNESILQFIATGEKKALEFLVIYLNKVLSDSGLKREFDRFFAAPNANSFTHLKEHYCNFIIEHTPINGLTESRRIFSKVLNPLAFDLSNYGTKAGRLSGSPISYHELFYNRVNFRDHDKPKGTPRSTFLANFPEDTATEIYQVERAKKHIKRYHDGKSEINRYRELEANNVHHIFPKHQFPELSDTFENLILITSGQHLDFAHPNANTQQISKSYQLVALLAKLDSIEKSVYREKDEFYNLAEFMRVVNIGLDKELLLDGMGVAEIRHRLAEEYVQ